MSRMACRALAMSMAVASLTPLTAQVAEPSAPGVHLDKRDNVTVLEARLSGHLIGYALPRSKDGHREMLLLVEPPAVTAPETSAASAASRPCDEAEGAPVMPPRARTLLRLNERGEGALEILRDDLPSDVEGIDAVDLDGNGIEEIVIARPGRLDALHDDGARRCAKGPDLLMTDPSLVREEPSHLEPRLAGRLDDGTASIVDVPTLGGIRFYGPTSPTWTTGPSGSSAAQQSWDLLAEAELPLEASRDDAGLMLVSPKVRPVGRAKDGALLFASGPDRVGRERLRSILIDPMAPEKARRIESWSLLPGAESVMDSAYLILDGRAALAVLTRPSDKLSLFGEKLLRLFFLDQQDRSRTGTEPALAVESHLNIWQQGTLLAVDVNRDGRQDLAVGYWKGLKTAYVVLDAYLQQEDGSFRRSPATTEVEVKDGRRSMVGFGRDLDGDGAADLMVLTEARMLVYRGSAESREGKSLVEKTPEWSVEVPQQAGGSGDDDEIDIQLGGDNNAGEAHVQISPRNAPRPIDLDGDGRPEILFAANATDGRGLFQVIRLLKP